MTTYSSDNKRIARNTILLYIRMIIVMIVTLFTSRIVLDLLGAEDYGINNIINGVIILFSFLNTALLTATQRFLNYYIGKGNTEKVNTVFCMSMNTYIILSIVVLVLGETIGLWFVNTKLNIPESRMYAAQWVYQFTLIQFILNLLRVPYNASIIAYEKMDFYAYISLFEVFAKLIICYILYIVSFDKLITISVLHTIIQFSTLVFYYIYCKKAFVTTKYRLFWESKMFKKIFGFSGWSLFGSLANLSAQQGLNILLNIFYGVTVNAAAGIANQVTHAVNGFVSNFQMAYSPQIIKSYASEEYKRFYGLIIKTSKFSFYLMALFAFPLIICTNEVLEIWLVDVPEYTAIFCKLILVFLLMDAYMMPMVFAVQATGSIRNYQIIMSLIIFLNFPIAYFGLKTGMPPYCVWFARILINAILFGARLVYLYKHLEFPVSSYLKHSLVPVLVVSCCVIPLPMYVHLHITNTWLNVIFVCLSFFICYAFFVYTFGFSKTEKDTIIQAISNRFHYKLKKS